MEEQGRKKAPVIIELDELELADVVGGLTGPGPVDSIPQLMPSRCPEHRPVSLPDINPGLP